MLIGKSTTSKLKFLCFRYPPSASPDYFFFIAFKSHRGRSRISRILAIALTRGSHESLHVRRPSSPQPRPRHLRCLRTDPGTPGLPLPCSLPDAKHSLSFIFQLLLPGLGQSIRTFAVALLGCNQALVLKLPQDRINCSHPRFIDSG